MPYGVTEQILESYAKIIIDLSLNKQVRRGDPIRHLDIEMWKAERASTGLSDGEIANRIGLAVPQVTYIRNIVERRLFRTNQYRKLYRLGGGKRYRSGQYVDPEQALAMDATAEVLRKSLVFDPQQVARYVNDGWWKNETLIDLVEKHATQQSGELAIQVGKAKLSWKDLADQIDRASARLETENIGRGNAVSINIIDDPSSIILTLAALRNSNTVLPVPGQANEDIETHFQICAHLEHSNSGELLVHRTILDQGNAQEDQPNYIAEILKSELNRSDDQKGHAQRLGIYRAVGGDIAMLLFGGGEMNNVVPHTHHTLLANGRALAYLFDASKPGAISVETLADPVVFAVLLSLWLQLGVPLYVSTEKSKSQNQTQEQTLNVRPCLTTKESELNGMVMTFALSEEQTEVYFSAETLCCLSRKANGASANPWNPLAGIEVQEIDISLAYCLRGPGFAPGYVGEKSTTPEVFQPENWVRMRLDNPIRKTG